MSVHQLLVFITTPMRWCWLRVTDITLNEVGLIVIASFAAVHARVPPHKLVFIDQKTFGMVSAFRDVVGILAADLVERWYAHTIYAKQREVVGA